MVISASMRVVGILLVSALITLPIAIAMRITKRFQTINHFKCHNWRIFSYNGPCFSILYEYFTRWCYCSTISFIIRTYNVIQKSIVRLKRGNNL